MSEAGNWCLIESDPGVFTELIRNIGVDGVQVEELYALDQDLLGAMKPIYGLIFLFKWQREMQVSNPTYAGNVPDLFFANQVITNACATQAILSILLNTPNIELGNELSQLKSFTMDLPPDMRGLAISNSELVRTVHNSFARPETFVVEDKTASGDEDAFHFIAYIPHGNRVYELDGLQPEPIDHGDFTGGNWLEKVTPIIQSRIERYAGNEIRFNLMAVIRDRQSLYKEELSNLDTVYQELKNVEDSESQLADIQLQINDLKSRIAAEQDKYENYKAENIRRRHNFLPLIVDMLKALAQKKQLEGLVAKAKAKGNKSQS